MDRENFELFKDYAKKAAVDDDFVRWVGLSDRLIFLLSDPREYSIRERAFSVCKSSGLLAAQVETTSMYRGAVDSGKVRELSDAEAERLFAAVNWSVFFEHHLVRLGQWSSVNRIVEVAARYRFRIWDRLSASVRDRLLAAVRSEPGVERLIRQLGASPGELSEAMQAKEAREQERFDGSVSPRDSEFLSQVFAAYWADADDERLQNAVAEALRGRGFDLCEQDEGWEGVFTELTRSGSAPEDWPEELHRFVLCLACDRSNRLNPSLTSEVILDLIADRNGDVEDRRIVDLLSPLSNREAEGLPGGYRTELFTTWVFEIVGAIVELREGSAVKQAVGPLASTLDILRGGRDPELKVLIETAQETAEAVGGYSAVLDFIESIEGVHDVDSIISDGRFRFLLEVGIFCGQHPFESRDFVDMAADLSLSRQVARGVPPGGAVRVMFEPGALPMIFRLPIPEIERLARAVEQYGEVSAVFARWFADLPRDFERLPAYLVEMGQLLGTLTSDRDSGNLEEEYVLVQPRAWPFRVRQSVHPEFVHQAARWLSDTADHRALIEDTPTGWFFTRTVFLTALSWLDAQPDFSETIPEWVTDHFVEHTNLAFDAARLGASNKGPFAGLPNGEATHRYLELLSSIVTVLYETGGLQRVLTPLLLAFRSFSRPAVAPDLHVSPDVGVGAPADKVAGALSNLINFIFRAPRRAKQESSNELRDAFANFLLSRFKRRRSPMEPRATAGWDPGATEPDGSWRHAYLQALIDLRVNPGGKVHRLCVALADQDPSEEVCKAALKGAKTLSKERTTSADISPKRAMLNSWWWLRRCHLEALGVEVDEKAAQMTRTREVRMYDSSQDARSFNR